MEHRGNLCETVRNSEQSSVIFSEEVVLVEEGSGRTFLPTNISEDICLKRSLKIGHEIGTSL